MDKNKTLEEGLKRLFETYRFSMETEFKEQKDSLDVYLSKDKLIQIYPKPGIKILSIIPLQGRGRFKFCGLNYHFNESAIRISSEDITYFISLVPKEE